MKTVTQVVYCVEDGKLYSDGVQVNLDPPPNHQLLVDLETWRGYLRVLLARNHMDHLQWEAYKAFAIADDQLALTLNKVIGEKPNEIQGTIGEMCG